MSEKIAAVIPAYNEEGKIGVVVSKVLAEKQVERVIVVDDGSTDRTVEEAEKEGALVLRQGKNSGVGAAIRAGLHYAKQNGYSIAVILGGDDQDNPDEMHRILYPILHDRFVFVQGSRYMPGGTRINIPLFRRVTTEIFSILLHTLLSYPITDGTNGFRAFRLSILDNPSIRIDQEWLNHYELEPYLFYKAIDCGLPVTEVPVTKRYPENRKGYTKMVPILSWWSILRPLLFLKLGIAK
ncbi:MAG: glycosyltransferase family 2 protein [Elusimicrobia bacterium]|nr:glycosyltransferase family 2 protein [Elusimicrobiota bacterium]MBI2915893.1 glycosyltransferase family 2 protein [Elusimicrobiota bacterium]MBI3012233.1 glycosyltransferase family 2 protein [Elusimicrobiota bacterium]